MIGITEIASFIPNENILASERSDGDKDFLSNKIGTTILPQFREMTIQSACKNAYNNLFKKISIDISEIECIVLCTQNPDFNGLPHNSALIQSEIGAGKNTACFDIGLGCSGYVYAISIIQSFMLANGMKKGLLFTCDPYSKIINPSDKNTAPLFGDAATVTYLSDVPKYNIEKSIFSTCGSEFKSIFNDNGTFFMNGRSVFNFVMKEVPKQIDTLRNSVNLKDEDVDLYVLHQGSKFMIEKVGRKISNNEKKIPFDITNTGNTVSSSIPIIFERLISKAKQNIILCGFGVGLSCASTYLKLHKEE